MRHLKRIIPTDAKDFQALCKQITDSGKELPRFNAEFENGKLISLRGDTSVKITYEVKKTPYSIMTDSKGKETKNYKHPKTIITHHDLDPKLETWAKSKGLT